MARFSKQIPKQCGVHSPSFRRQRMLASALMELSGTLSASTFMHTSYIPLYMTFEQVPKRPFPITLLLSGTASKELDMCGTDCRGILEAFGNEGVARRQDFWEEAIRRVWYCRLCL